MKKSTFLFVSLLLSFRFWYLSFIPLNRDIFLVLFILWGFLGFIFFPKKQRKSLYTIKYKKYFYWILIGVMISMFNADLFWDQNLLTTLIAQRFIYAFIFLIPLLYIQPSEEDILKALKWISFCTFLVWLLGVFNPALLGKGADDEVVKSQTDFGYYVNGIHFVVFYFYFVVQKYIEKFKWKDFLKAMLLFSFLLIYQNRSILIGAVIVVFYSLFRFRSRYKGGLILSIAGILCFIVIYTQEIWLNLIEATEHQLNSDKYNRWKSLYYYFNEYSPNWFTYLFGNGMPSGGNSKLGDLMWNNFTKGIYASDLGMIGMWTTYGLIPLVTIFAVIFKIIYQKKFPLYLKFICFHIIAVPTIFQFWFNPGVYLFIIIFYMYAYHNENNRSIKECYQ